MRQHQANEKEMSEREKRYDEWDKKRRTSITNDIVEMYPRYFIFFASAVAFCAVRAPTDFAVALTYLAILCRILHVFGWYCHKKIIVGGGLGLGMFINVILIFTGLVHENNQ